jgi:hypothetical protein
MSTPVPQASGPPQVATGFATDITPTTATLWGILYSDREMGYGFSYGTDTVNQEGGSWLGAGAASTPQLMFCQISGLTPGTTYHFSLSGIYKSDTVPDNRVHGADLTFVTPTPPPGPPVVTTGTPTDITATTATLTGTVNPGGLDTNFLFGYGTDTHYQSGDTGSTLLVS